MFLTQYIITVEITGAKAQKVKKHVSLNVQCHQSGINLYTYVCVYVCIHIYIYKWIKPMGNTSMQLLLLFSNLFSIGNSLFGSIKQGASSLDERNQFLNEIA